MSQPIFGREASSRSAVAPARSSSEMWCFDVAASPGSGNPFRCNSVAGHTCMHSHGESLAAGAPFVAPPTATQVDFSPSPVTAEEGAPAGIVPSITTGTNQATVPDTGSSWLLLSLALAGTLSARSFVHRHQGAA